MGVDSRTVEMPFFFKVRRDVLADVPQLLENYGIAFERPLIITDRRSTTFAERFRDQNWPEAMTHVIDSNSLQECLQICHRWEGHIDAVIGFGGGRALDVGKYVANTVGCRYLSVPTIPSHDGLASPVSVLKDGTGRSQSLGVRGPIGVLVDLNLIAQAPRESILAGTGDMISNLSAVQDWRLAERDVGERVDDYALLVSSQSAQMVWRELEKKPAIDSERYVEILVEGLILSGIAMTIAGNSRPASGAEHEISHAIDALYPETINLHGFQVAFGTLVAETIRGKDTAELRRLYREIGLPLGYIELGLTLEQATAALVHAPQTRPTRYTILKKRKLTSPEAREILLSL